MRVHRVPASRIAAFLDDAVAVVASALPGEDDPAGLVRTVSIDVEGKSVVRLLALDGDRVVGVAVGDTQGETGHLDLVAVAPDARGCGIGRSLLRETEAATAELGARRHVAGGSARRYAWPGVDTRYIAALALLERHGYRIATTAFDMGVDLAAPDAALDAAPDAAPDALPDARAAVERAAASGIAIEPVSNRRRASMQRLIAREFSAGWAFEMDLAIDQPESGGFVAVDGEGEVLGFAGHGVFRRRAFGPTGTAAAARGTGVGAALLLCSLHALREAGLDEARIGWSAETALPFYARVAGADVAATYWILEKP